jgi:Flp pilus assembly protein TadD
MKESDLLFRKGMDLLRNGDYRRAEETFNRAKELANKETATL